MKHLFTVKNEDLGLRVDIIRDHRGTVAIAKDTDADEMISARIWGPHFTDHRAETSAVDYAHKLVDLGPDTDWAWHHED